MSLRPASPWLQALRLIVRPLLLTSTLCVAAGIVSPNAASQLTEQRARQPYLGSATVSVAALRIPEEAWKHFNKAKDALEHNRLADYERESLKAIAIAPRFADAFLLRATQQIRQHSYDAAIASVQAAQNAEPGVKWAAIILAGAYNGMERYADARVVLANLRGQEAESWQAKYELARLETGQRNIEAALHWSDAALQAAPPSFSEVHLVRSNSLIVAQRWSEAAAQLEIYLATPGPQSHRSEALASLESVRAQMRDQPVATVASR